MQNPRTRAILLFVLALTFGVLIFGGYLINRQKPPIPDRVVTEAGDVLFTGQDIMAGQQFYFSRGGQHIGTIWGHGSYLAPDWSADFLHRMGLYLAARHRGLEPDRARYFSQEAFDDLPAPERARLTALVTEEIKTNRYDAGDGTLTLTAFQALTAYYSELFASGNEAMGLQSGIVRSDADGLGLTRFFFWLAWAAGTQRPSDPRPELGPHGAGHHLRRGRHQPAAFPGAGHPDVVFHQGGRHPRKVNSRKRCQCRQDVVPVPASWQSII